MATPRKKPHLTQEDLDYLTSLPGSAFEGFVLDLASRDVKRAAELREQVNRPRTIDWSGYSRKEIAAVLDVSTETIDFWTANGMAAEIQGKFNGGGKAYYNLLDSIRWLAKYRAKGRGSSGGGDREAAELALLHERQKMAEIKRRKQEGELIDAHEMQVRVMELCSRVQKAVQSIRSKMGEEAVEEFESLIEEIQVALA